MFRLLIVNKFVVIFILYSIFFNVWCLDVLLFDYHKNDNSCSFFEKVYQFIHSFIIYLAACTSLLPQRWKAPPTPKYNWTEITLEEVWLIVGVDKHWLDYTRQVPQGNAKNDGVWKSITDVMKKQGMCFTLWDRASKQSELFWLAVFWCVTSQFRVHCLWLSTSCATSS